MYNYHFLFVIMISQSGLGWYTWLSMLMEMSCIAGRLVYLVADGHVQCKKMLEEEIVSSLFIIWVT